MSPNGGGWVQQISTGRFTSLNWSVEGNTLKLGYRWHSADGVLFRFCRFLQSKTGWHPWVISGEDWEIREVTADSILLWPKGVPEPYKLTRLPE